MQKDGKDKIFKRWLDVILALSGENGMTAVEIAAILGTSLRNAYYTLKLMGEAGLIVNHKHGLYSIDPMSPFFHKLMPSVTFTDAQAIYLYRLLNNSNNRNDPLAGAIMRKIYRFYHLDTIKDTPSSPKEYMNMSKLQRAIKKKRMVVLHDYSSSNSNTVSNRTVEPYAMVGENTDVRAYELKSGRNKNFKISRIGEVEMLESGWTHEEKHQELFTDMFMFSSAERHHVRLRLDIKAHNYMLEEYPHSEPLMTQHGNTHWLYEADVANYAGIARFILGLFDDIEVVEDDGLKKYIEERIRKMNGAVSA